MKRIVAHLDMDAFFASVEEVATPGFLGKPIVVGSEIINGFGRGVVSTANYKARAYGIHSALPIMTAWKMSEKAKAEGKEPAIFLPVDFNLYNRVSASVHSIIKKYAEVVEQASIDEFYFDLSFAGSYKKAEAICKKIKAEIKKKERITCSVGIGPNKLISKICAGIKKPDGMMMVQESKARDFLNPLPIRELPGIGPKTAEVLYKENIRIIKDLTNLSVGKLIELLGNKNGGKLYFSARGINDDPIVEYHEVKSIGEQTTLRQNTLEPNIIFDAFEKLSAGVLKRFLESGFEKFNNITVTVRFADFETKSVSKTFKQGFAVSDKKQINLEIIKLVLPFLDRRNNPRRKPIRLVGVRVEKLS